MRTTATQDASTAAPIPSVDDATSRRAKKRELDRRAQRASRERNRNRIAYLEATIQAMGQQDSNGTIASLINQLSDMTRHRDSLAKVVSSIETSIQVHHKVERVGTTIAPDQAPQTHNETTRFQHWPADHVTSGTPAMDVDDLALDVFAPGGMVTWDVPVSDTADQALATATKLTSSWPVTNSFSLSGDPDVESFLGGRSLSARQTRQGDGVIVPGPDSACECSGSRQDPGSPGLSAAASIWRCANEALGGREMLPRNVLDMEDAMSDDIPVRVILEGWEAVEQSGKLPPLWKKLRQTDSLQFRNCPDTERLAILRLMHRLLRYQAEPTFEQCAKLPAWYLSRPSQSLPHSSAIDFFVWPGVRERFVFSQHQYCSNLFWKVFAEGFRIMWPFEFRDCYRRNVETGRYCVSPEFEDRIRDINSWTMSTDFFNYFPEMYADIPAYQEVPRSLGWKQSSINSPRRPGGAEELEFGSSTRG